MLKVCLLHFFARTAFARATLGLVHHFKLSDGSGRRDSA
jgi:hypothetical protein